MDALNPLEYIRLVYELTDKYIPSPAKEILLATFGAVLLLGLIYGLLFRGFVQTHPKKAAEPVSEEEQEDEEEDRRTPLKIRLREAKQRIKELEAKSVISRLERYYLYFNGIANASLMLGFSVLVDRQLSASVRDQLPVKQQIASFISILLVGLSTSIILTVLVDLISDAPDRRTDAINRAFLIAFAINALVFLAYHMNYLNF